MKNIPDGSIDMILCDLPYGTTAIAAYHTGRKSICIEKDETYYKKSVERMYIEENPK